MKPCHRPHRWLHSASALWALAWLATSPASAANSDEVKKLFAHPPREYATAPLWVWNDQLTEQQVRETLRDLAGQEVRQVFVHPRPGLMTPYLSPEWFQLWRVALDEARRLDMNVWIYDENSYPSGFAGGWVPELMPEARGRGLQLRVTPKAPAWAADTMAVFRLDGSTATDVSSAARAGKLPPAGPYLTAVLQRAPDRAWTADHAYVDLLHPGVTAKFLDVTLAAYQREIGGEFGGRVPGVFTDEPHLRPAGGLHWSDDLEQQFQQRRGYGLIASLPSLSQAVGDWRQVRHDYYSVLNELFIERWAKPYFEWCEKHQLAFTGHYWEHQWPDCGGVPSNMAMAAWQQIPGIDCLMNQYREENNAQFGNVRFVRELASVANQLGRKRTLCEIYGAGGWDLRFEDMKRIGDWLAVLGVNLFDEHLSYITLRGARKRDHPQSFSYHEPWWDAYHVNARYLARLSCALSQGEQVNRILVLEPTTTAWMYQGDAARLKELGGSYFQLLMALEAAQIEYDIGDEDIMARHGLSAKSGLQVGRRTYQTVVLPAGTENLEGTTVKLLGEFLRRGGRVLACGEPPARVGGSVADDAARVARSPAWQRVEATDVPARLKALVPLDGFAIRRAPDDRGILFHQRRQLADGELLFLVNTSIEHPSAGTVQTALRGIEQWDLDRGTTKPAAFTPVASGAELAFRLPPSGSLLLFLSRQAIKATPSGATAWTPVAPSGPFTIRRQGPNVLTLDHVDITAGGQTKTNAYFYQAGQLAFKQSGMERNPWDSAVQFRDNLVKRTFAPDSGFEASYRFTITGPVPADLAIVIESAGLYGITCNGRPLQARAGDWWLDKAFARISLAAAARAGENVVTLKAAPFNIRHELEPVYIIGSFALRAAEKGFEIAPEQPLQWGRWNDQGLPFHAHGVSYETKYDLPSPSGRYVVALPNWYGSVAKVAVNGRPAGHVVAPPWECDVTDHMRRGANTVEVVVIGTLKNLLGPHHGKPAPGSAWPRQFQTGPAAGLPPGREYDTIGYGLFAPFELRQAPAPR